MAFQRLFNQPSVSGEALLEPVHSWGLSTSTQVLFGCLPSGSLSSPPVTRTCVLWRPVVTVVTGCFPSFSGRSSRQLLWRLLGLRELPGGSFWKCWSSWSVAILDQSWNYMSTMGIFIHILPWEFGSFWITSKTWNNNDVSLTAMCLRFFREKSRRAMPGGLGTGYLATFRTKDDLRFSTEPIFLPLFDAKNHCESFFLFLICFKRIIAEFPNKKNGLRPFFFCFNWDFLFRYPFWSQKVPKNSQFASGDSALCICRDDDNVRSSGASTLVFCRPVERQFYEVNGIFHASEVPGLEKDLGWGFLVLLVWVVTFDLETQRISEYFFQVLMWKQLI